VSRQRQAARAERERLAAERAAAEQAERERLAVERARRERRALTWRRLRLWQHGPAFRRHRERWGALATLVLLILFVVWLATDSVLYLLVTALALVVCAPVLLLLFFDRSRR
jgi:Flp pilus assembly protein TadB